MNLNYLQGKSWVQTTREERQFCAALFSVLRKRPSEFVLFLHHETECFQSHQIVLDVETKWEVGFEVALGRDLPNPPEGFLSLYRKFDLVLFSQSLLVIIEAKAQQRYSTKELNRYQSEKNQLHSQLGIDVIFVGLCSSTYLARTSLDLTQGFDAILTWKQVASRWYDEHFQRAECVYGT